MEGRDGGIAPVNVVAAHAFVHGADASGSERAAHLSTAYGVPSTVFPVAAHYVALGHLHRPQTIPGPCPIRYSGSPLALDFGEAGQQKVALVVQASAGTPARVTEVPLTSGRQLRVVKGTLAELRSLTVSDEHFVRVHRSAIVRLSLVDTLHRSEGSDYQVQLKGGVRLPVGRSRREALERRLGRTW